MDIKMTEAQILRRFDDALKNGDVFPVYQSQYNHSADPGPDPLPCALFDGV